MHPSRPGDAELRADRIVYEGMTRWRTGFFVHSLILKQIITAEIAAAVRDERNRWEKELVAMLESLYRAELRAQQCRPPMDLGNAILP